ncbi:MAM and LDL-receptor class A domain-containing protein 1-like [Saccostrea cucullata]|uniref:MAM and LDL-receptor class A domain-containing protein 1-like n=1 Tax=Saccostrea cuccullata TaxID=36930 RepID=UPI002ED5D5BF
MWTETLASASPYLSLLGCFSNQGDIPHSNLSRASVVDCQFECSSSSYFAISDTACSCLENFTSSADLVDASLCNITCDGTYCGGQDTMNIYYVVDKGFFQNKTVYWNPNFTSCLSYQCLGHRNVYKEADCDDMSISLSDCCNYFSCTFEPGEPCFLYQDDDDDFDWTIQNKATKYGPVQSYEGSYFAFVDDEQYGEGNSTTLVSNVGFTDGQWCIHLRYYIQNVSTDARLEVFKSGEQNPFFIFKKSANKEWKYAYKNIIMSYDERVIFKFTRGKETSDFALDDVIMIKGSCEETVTSMFKMKGEINCNFEGNEDVCFQQNKKGSTWTITRDGSTPTEDTGPSKNIEGNYFLYFAANKFGNRGKAVLSSSFYLEDINITFSMQYSMYGEDIGQLYVYLKDERNTTRDIFKEEGDQREGWKNFTTNITVESKNKLYIEGSKNGSGNKGDIAIDNIKIIIIEPENKNSWLAYNERCARILGSYIINNEQITDLPCLSDSLERWTGIIRPQRRTSVVTGFQETPTAVQLYSYINNVPTYDWEIYDPRRTRPFVCKRILNSSSDSCVVFRRVTSNHATETTDINNGKSKVII